MPTPMVISRKLASRPSMGSAMTASERSLRSRIGAYALHAAQDPRQTTAKARAAFLARFEAAVDPEGILPPEERQRRALSARRAYFARLALKSARVRRRKKDKKPTGGASGPAVSGNTPKQGGNDHG